MEGTVNRKSSMSSMIKYLIMFMILFISIMAVASILRKEIDISGIVIGSAFIIFLIFLKWIIKESGLD